MRHLLYFFELANQALEVKMESLYTFPSFLHETVRHVKSRNAIEQLARVGEQILQHVRVLTQVITDLGGAIEQDTLPRAQSETASLVSTLSFQEELSMQILDECRLIIERDWQDSHMKRWVQERLLTIASETRMHTTLLERLFAETQPRYRDLVLERFRVTALP